MANASDLTTYDEPGECRDLKDLNVEKVDMKTKSFFASYGACLALALLVQTSSANVITYTLNHEFSGGATPSAPPVLTLTDASGGVDALFDLSALASSEFVTEWDLNMNPSITLPLAYSFGTKVGTFSNPTITQSQNSEKADGAGYYDIEVLFATGPASAKFNGGEQFTIHFDGVNVGDFAYLSTGGGANGDYHTAAHVQGIGSVASLSGWVADADSKVPDGGMTALMVGSVLLGMAGIMRRIRKQ